MTGVRVRDGTGEGGRWRWTIGVVSGIGLWVLVLGEALEGLAPALLAGGLEVYLSELTIQTPLIKIVQLHSDHNDQV